MILGVGTDIVQVQRIQRICTRWKGAFERRIFSVEERAEQASHMHATFVAGRFAAKEAAAKALGTGIAKGVGWHDLTIFRQQNGAPLLILSGAALRLANELGVTANHLSISHERDYAMAFVVLEGV